MIDAFWTQIAGKLADRWLAVTGSALVFWVGVLLALTQARGSAATLDAADRTLRHHGPATQALVILVALLAVAASGLLVQRLTGPTLRLIEGYWPKALSRLRDRRLTRVEAKLGADNGRWQQLAAAVQDGNPTRQQVDEFSRLDAELRHTPDRALDYMPTTVGMILRAAETRPADRYGIGVVALWPHLWSILPDPLRQDLAAARLSLDNAVAALLWSGIYIIAATPISWWTLPTGAAIAAAAWCGWIPARARAFATLIEAAYDLHHLDLYPALGVPLPPTRQAEIEAGRALTALVQRGTAEGVIDRPGRGA